MVNREFALLMIFVHYLYIHDKNSELIYDAKFAYEVKIHIPQITNFFIFEP